MLLFLEGADQMTRESHGQAGIWTLLSGTQIQNIMVPIYWASCPLLLQMRATDRNPFMARCLWVTILASALTASAVLIQLSFSGKAPLPILGLCPVWFCILRELQESCYVFWYFLLVCICRWKVPSVAGQWVSWQSFWGKAGRELTVAALVAVLRTDSCFSQSLQKRKASCYSGF